MRRGLALGLLLGWLLGIGTGLLGAALTGGWYEYRLIGDRIEVREGVVTNLVNNQGWQIERTTRNSAGGDEYYLRRPRLRLP